MALSNHNPFQETKPQFSSGEVASVNRFLAAVMQESADIFCFLTPLGEMQEVYPSWQNFTGQKENVSRGRGWLETFHPADQPQVEEMLIQTVTSGRSSEYTCQMRRYDESYRLMHWRLIPLREPSGAIFEIVVCGTDIMMQEMVEQMSEAQVQLAVKASGVGMWDWDLVTNRLVWTDQKKALFGLSPDTPISSNEHFLALLHPDDRERVHQLNMRALAEKQEYYTKDYRTIWPDGSVHWLSDRARVVSGAHGNPVHIVGATVDITEIKQAEEQLQQDITERKRVEEALRESEVRFRHLVDSNLIGITVSDLEGNIHEANGAFLSLVGYSQEDLAAGQMNWIALTPPEYQVRSAQAVEELLTTGMVQPFEKEFVTKNGKRVPVLVGRTLLRREGSSSPLVIGFVLDLSAQKELERQKDLFLGITGHELKTPLTALRGTLQLVQRRLKRVTTEDHVSPEWTTFAQDLTKNLEDSVRQIDVQTRLINDLLDVSRITAGILKLERRRCELGSILPFVRSSSTTGTLRVIFA